MLDEEDSAGNEVSSSFQKVTFSGLSLPFDKLLFQSEETVNIVCLETVAQEQHKTTDV